MRRSALPVIVWVVVAVACTGEDATPIDLDADPVTTSAVPTSAVPTPHLLEPTEQMRDLAAQQCLDDPELAQGEVNAVDPADPDQILSTVVVDCDDVRP